MNIVDRNLGNMGCCWRLLLGALELLHQMTLDKADIANEAWMFVKFDWKDSWQVSNRDTES